MITSCPSPISSQGESRTSVPLWKQPHDCCLVLLTWLWCRTHKRKGSLKIVKCHLNIWHTPTPYLCTHFLFCQKCLSSLFAGPTSVVPRAAAPWLWHLGDAPDPSLSATFIYIWLSELFTFYFTVISLTFPDKWAFWGQDHCLVWLCIKNSWYFRPLPKYTKNSLTYTHTHIFRDVEDNSYPKMVWWGDSK